MKRTAAALAITAVVALGAVPAHADHGWPHHRHRAERTVLLHDSRPKGVVSKGDVLRLRLSDPLRRDRQVDGLGVIGTPQRGGQVLIACTNRADPWVTPSEHRAYCDVTRSRRFVRVEVFHTPRQAGGLRLSWFTRPGRGTWIFDWLR